MALIFVTRRIPEIGLGWMRDGGHEVVVSGKDGVLTPEELRVELVKRPYDALVSLLTDQITVDLLEIVPTLKIVANYAVGYNNIAVADLQARGVVVANTPGVLTDSVAEYTTALVLAVAKRISEADRFMRAGRYEGWAPELLLGGDLAGKTLGIVGAGRIGLGVAKRLVNGFGMKAIYYDVKRNEVLEQEAKADFVDSVEGVLRLADVVSLHVPLLPETQHLINAKRLALMKPTAYLINTARGPVIDEKALVEALKCGQLKGAGLDVFEAEPTLAPGLAELENVIITPHIASASEETRNKMSELTAFNINEFFLGRAVPNPVSAS